MNVHEAVQEVQVEEDAQSQDLFFSDDEFSSSEPQDIQSDSEYSVSSSEPSQSTQESQVSNDSLKERMFLVFEEVSKKLLQHCLRCGSLIAMEHSDLKLLKSFTKPTYLTLNISKTHVITKFSSKNNQ